MKTFCALDSLYSVLSSSSVALTVSTCGTMCHSNAQLTHKDRERGHSRIRPCSPPLFWFTPSPTFSFPPRSLSLTSSAPAVHQPPAVLPAVSALRTNSLTTMQVRGREKEHTALTIDQWRPLKQSLPFSPSLLSPGLEKTNLWSGG